MVAAPVKKLRARANTKSAFKDIKLIASISTAFFFAPAQREYTEYNINHFFFYAT